MQVRFFPRKTWKAVEAQVGEDLKLAGATETFWDRMPPTPSSRPLSGIPVFQQKLHQLNTNDSTRDWDEWARMLGENVQPKLIYSNRHLGRACAPQLQSC